MCAFVCVYVMYIGYIIQGIFYNPHHVPDKSLKIELSGETYIYNTYRIRNFINVIFTGLNEKYQ